MKQVLLITLLTWGAVTVEEARPDLIPAGAIMLPLLAMAMLWNASGTGIFTGSTLLILAGILRPQSHFLLPAAFAAAAAMLSIYGQPDPWKPGHRSFLRPPESAHPLVLVCIGATILFVPGIVTNQNSGTLPWTQAGQFAVITIPLTILLTALMKLAGEFGLRRTV